MGPRLAPRRRAGMEAAGLPFDGGEQGSESGRTGCNNRVGWVEELALWPGGLVLPEGRDEMIIGMISEGREIRHLETKRFILASSSESKNRRIEESKNRAVEQPKSRLPAAAAAQQRDSNSRPSHTNATWYPLFHGPHSRVAHGWTAAHIWGLVYAAVARVERERGRGEGGPRGRDVSRRQPRSRPCGRSSRG
jgi:hypothetical protein